MRKFGPITFCLLLLATTTVVLIYSPSNAQSTTLRGFETPAQVNFYVNGFPDRGEFNLSSPPGSHPLINITASYPKADFTSTENSFAIQYSFAPFPLSGMIPNWLALTADPLTLTMTKGTSSSTNLGVTIDNAAQNGNRGSFALHTLYTDPMTEIQVLHVIVFDITVDSSSNGVLPSTTFHESPSSSPNSPLSSTSWALGAGLCDNSNKNPCGSVGISWSSTIGVYTSVDPPSFVDSSTTYITLNGSPASGYLFQSVLAAPSTGSTWQGSAWVLYPSSPACSFNTGTVSAGITTSLQIWYLTPPTSAWYIEGPGGTYQISSYCTVPSSTTFQATNQEPFAFESYDSTGTNFKSLMMNANPAFQYLQGTTWYNPPGAYVVNANNAGSWGSFVIGGGQSTPSVVLEGGHFQCSSISTYQLYLGYYTASPLNGCGTQTFGTKLMT